MDAIKNCQTTDIEQPETLAIQTIDISVDRPKSSKRQPRRRNFPLMIKRANKVEKYISEFVEKTVQRNRQLQSRYTVKLSGEVNQSQASLIKQRSKSVFVSALEPISFNTVSTKSLDYQKIINQDSIKKIDTLNKIQEDYVDLKQQLKSNPIVLPRLAKIKTEQQEVTKSQIQYRLKKKIVQVSGRRYFKDLFLITKGRDKVFTTLSKLGDYKLGTSSLSVYSQIVNQVNSHQQQVSMVKQLTKKEILQQRKAKKVKMMQNKYMNGNVYYDFHSLSKKEKENLKKISKFAASYGIK